MRTKEQLNAIKALRREMTLFDREIYPSGKSGKEVTLHLRLSDVNHIAEALSFIKNSGEYKEFQARKTLAKLTHWFDSLRPEDKLGFDSAHALGGIIGEARVWQMK